jgi:hypothetical protein
MKGVIQVTGRQGRRRRKLLDDLKARRGYSHLKEEALDRTVWGVRFGRSFGAAVRQTAKRMNDYKIQMRVQQLWRKQHCSIIMAPNGHNTTENQHLLRTGVLVTLFTRSTLVLLIF